jgi:hypothetical protein
MQFSHSRLLRSLSKRSGIPVDQLMGLDDHDLDRVLSFVILKMWLGMKARQAHPLWREHVAAKSAKPETKPPKGAA